MNGNFTEMELKVSSLHMKKYIHKYTGWVKYIFSLDRETWHATVHGVEESDTVEQLS